MNEAPAWHCNPICSALLPSCSMSAACWSLPGQVGHGVMQWFFGWRDRLLIWWRVPAKPSIQLRLIFHFDSRPQFLESRCCREQTDGVTLWIFSFHIFMIQVYSHWHRLHPRLKAVTSSTTYVHAVVHIRFVHILDAGGFLNCWGINQKIL